jgi:hypothetical protein
MAWRAAQNQTWPGPPAAARIPPCPRPSAGRGPPDPGSAWWAGFTFNGITRCEKGTVDLVGGEQLSDGWHLLALNRQACSRHWLDWHDCR